MPEKQTNVGGLRAVELSFRPMRDIASGRSICYLSRTQLNTPLLGTLMPSTFRPVAESNELSDKLFPLELLQLAESVRRLNEAGRPFNWLSMDLPMTILRDRATSSVADKICEQFSLTSNEFCFCIPEQVLFENDGVCADNVARYRRRGYHIILTGFGENGCPYIKLSELAVDYVMLSPSVTSFVGKNEKTDQAVHSIVDFINNLGIEPIADGVKNSIQAESFYEFGCNFCVGPLSGDYISLDELIE